jgi:outer membrane protein insertion porin family
MNNMKNNKFYALALSIVSLVMVTAPLVAQTASEQEAAAAGGEWYQGKPIKDITFSGLRNVSMGDLEGVIQPYIGAKFSDDLFWDLQGRLYALELFDMISPNAAPSDALGSEVVIRFAVTERPVVSRINFTGNSGLRRSELQDVVTIKTNDVVNQAKLRIDEQAIAARYLEKGYPDIRVRTETEAARNGSIVVNFIVEEGERVTIEGFVFEGNSVFSERTLRSQLTLKAKGILNDGAFQRSKLLQDRLALTAYYRDRGYIDAEVQDIVETVRRDDKGNNFLTLTFRVYEGRSFSFGGVSFDGNLIFSTDELTALVYSKAGSTLNATRLEADLQRVADLYFENGYIFNSIDRNEERDSENGLIKYRIVIVERGRAHIQQILIKGNQKTKESVIRRELPLEAGDVFSKTKVMDGIRNLYNLQYFSNVLVDTPMGSADSLMNLVITVEEQPTTDLNLGITFSQSSDPNAFPLSGIFKWTDRNFRG